MFNAYVTLLFQVMVKWRLFKCLNQLHLFVPVPNQGTYMLLMDVVNKKMTKRQKKRFLCICLHFWVELLLIKVNLTQYN